MWVRLTWNRRGRGRGRAQAPGCSKTREFGSVKSVVAGAPAEGRARRPLASPVYVAVRWARNPPKPEFQALAPGSPQAEFAWRERSAPATRAARLASPNPAPPIRAHIPACLSAVWLGPKYLCMPNQSSASGSREAIFSLQQVALC